MNILAKTKIFSKISESVNLSRYYGFMEKTRLQKSHATVPLIEWPRRCRRAVVEGQESVKGAIVEGQEGVKGAIIEGAKKV